MTQSTDQPTPQFKPGDPVEFTDEHRILRQSFVTAIVPIGNYSVTELGYAIRGSYGDYVRVAADIKLIDQPTQPEAKRHGCPRHHWRRVRPLRGTEYYQCIHCEVKDCELPASSCQPCSECGGINTHEYACVFNKSHQPGWLGRVLPSERSAGGERCVKCGHERTAVSPNRLGVCVYVRDGIDTDYYKGNPICGHRCTFAPRLIESLWGGNLPALCDTCKSNLSREGRGTHGWDASRNQILCPTVCRFPRKGNYTFAPREAERHEFKESVDSDHTQFCEYKSGTGYCGLPREAEVHIGRDTKKMPPTEYQKPFKVKEG